MRTCHFKHCAHYSHYTLSSRTHTYIHTPLTTLHLHVSQASHGMQYSLTLILDIHTYDTSANIERDAPRISYSKQTQYSPPRNSSHLLSRRQYTYTPHKVLPQQIYGIEPPCCLRRLLKQNIHLLPRMATLSIRADLLSIMHSLMAFRYSAVSLGLRYWRRLPWCSDHCNIQVLRANDNVETVIIIMV